MGVVMGYLPGVALAACGDGRTARVPPQFMRKYVDANSGISDLRVSMYALCQ
jgi:hypothetical protein